MPIKVRNENKELEEVYNKEEIDAKIKTCLLSERIAVITGSLTTTITASASSGSYKSSNDSVLVPFPEGFTLSNTEILSANWVENSDTTKTFTSVKEDPVYFSRKYNTSLDVIISKSGYYLDDNKNKCFKVQANNRNTTTSDISRTLDFTIVLFRKD